MINYIESNGLPDDNKRGAEKAKQGTEYKQITLDRVMESLKTENLNTILMSTNISELDPIFKYSTGRNRFIEMRGRIEHTSVSEKIKMREYVQYNKRRFLHVIKNAISDDMK